MTKAEYVVNLYHCYVRCCPEKEKCKNCGILEVAKEIYGNAEYDI